MWTEDPVYKASRQWALQKAFELADMFRLKCERPDAETTWKMARWVERPNVGDILSKLQRYWRWGGGKGQEQLDREQGWNSEKERLE